MANDWRCRAEIVASRFERRRCRVKNRCTAASKTNDTTQIAWIWCLAAFGSRTYRRGLITEGEEQDRIKQENNVLVLGRIAEHFERLAAKYEWFQWHPWLPVEPDPPVPN